MQRLDEIAAYLYTQHLSKEFVRDYLNRIGQWLHTMLLTFPESDTPMSHYGPVIRRVVYKEYSFLYRLNGAQIEILTIHRDNLP